jgi:hypothetical protein
VAEGARLESVYTLTGIVGSNPTLSASIILQNKLVPALALNWHSQKIAVEALSSHSDFPVSIAFLIQNSPATTEPVEDYHRAECKYGNQ